MSQEINKLLGITDSDQPVQQIKTESNRYSPSIWVKAQIIIAKISIALTGISLIAAGSTWGSTQEMWLVAAAVFFCCWLSLLWTAHLVTLIEKCAFYLENNNSKQN